MSDYRIQVVFETFEKNSRSKRYRFAVIDPNKLRGYPANFVCILPKKIVDAGKPLSEFGRIFGKSSSAFAIELLKDALTQEKDEKVKTEIEKRLKSLELEQAKLICSCCHKEFEASSKIRYKRRLCPSCLEARFLQNKN